MPGQMGKPCQTTKLLSLYPSFFKEKCGFTKKNSGSATFKSLHLQGQMNRLTTCKIKNTFWGGQALGVYSVYSLKKSAFFPHRLTTGRLPWSFVKRWPWNLAVSSAPVPGSTAFHTWQEKGIPKKLLALIIFDPISTETRDSLASLNLT